MSAIVDENRVTAQNSAADAGARGSTSADLGPGHGPSDLAAQLAAAVLAGEHERARELAEQLRRAAIRMTRPLRAMK